jgi:hypothetical protein
LMATVRADLRSVLRAAIEQAQKTDVVVVAESPALAEAHRRVVLQKRVQGEGCPAD